MRPHLRPGQRTVVIVTVVLAVLAVSFMALAVQRSSAAGSAQAAERVEAGPDAGAGAVTVRVIGERLPDTDVVAAVFADLQDAWRTGSLRSGYAAVDTVTADTGAFCRPTADAVAGNAFYCPDVDGIVYDAAGLVPVLVSHYGVPGLTAALAHEFGHAVQARVGPTVADRAAEPQRYPPILVEAQADCAAGVFLREVVDGRSRRVHFGRESMVRALGPLLDFRDPVTADPDGAAAHGLGLDRLRFVLAGYRGDQATCRAMTTDDLSVTLGSVPVPAASEPRFADDEVVAAATDSVLTFDPTLAPAAPAEVDVEVAAPYGQFATAAAVALAMAAPRSDSPGAAACFVGAWTASVYGQVPATELGGWPGDADEALDLLRSRPGATFADLAGFADGFDDGIAACPG